MKNRVVWPGPKKHRQAQLQMLTGKNWVYKSDFFIKLENTERHPLNASQNLNILSLLLQLPNLDCFLMKISKISETVKKNLRFI